MSTSEVATSTADLAALLPDLMVRDGRRLRRRLEGTRKIRDATARQRKIDEIAAEIETAQARLRQRRDNVPKITYPPELPVSQRKDDLLAAIRDNQVVIVAGETGSGKTTQLPKICMELGRGGRGLIGHTQPRRLAARTVAERIAEELGTTLGEAVGYTVRFTDQVGENTVVKLMTDGILLAEIQRDRMLSQYDTLIIDEAHERSLNIDFILGYVKQLLPRRPDLKVVITSATIDPDRFSRHFDDAPVVEVSGRTYPVEIRYRPIIDPDDPDADPDRDQIQAICDAVRELGAIDHGDILVFCNGEREIRDAVDALAKLELRNTELAPLYARLSSADQYKVFQPHTGRRIVLATNVAETSLTVPGIRYVVDAGTARISRYSHRLKVQRLPIEPVSQASANQRAGRCGRTSDGVCIRLYSQEDYLARPEFTDPEILRTNLASVILQMTAIGLGDLAAFPFIDPPDRRNIADGVQLLQELGALDPNVSDERKRLTDLGRQLARLPIDPRLARMIVAADANGSLREVLVIAAALSIQDPRERPTDLEQQADQQHARFADPDSDFGSFLNLWQYLREQQKELSSNRFRKLCRAEFLNYLRVREWQDLHGQLRQITRNLGLTSNEESADPDRIHTALLAGLLSHVGLKEGPRNEYLGARNAKFAVFPGSALFKKPPRWVMAAELVETSRLWGRMVARVEPEWIERLAEHLVRRTYSEPRWERDKGAVMATEKVTLYGIPIVAARTVNYSRVDPSLCRELFIRHALVDGEWQTRHKFFHRNRALLSEVADLENRARRRDILVDDETLFDFYDERVDKDVLSTRHFDTWWNKARRDQPDLLTFDRDMLVNSSAGAVTEAEYPNSWRSEGPPLPLTYQFEPGTKDDGVTVDVPLAVLGQVDADEFGWQVPGLREELVTALIRTLPKQLRRNFVPAPDFARAALAEMPERAEPLLAALSRELRKLTGVTVPLDAWQPDQVPDHLKITFRVIDEHNKKITAGKNLPALRAELQPRTRSAMAAAAQEITRTGLLDWTFDTLPHTYEQRISGFDVTSYPAIVDAGACVDIRVFDTEPEQRAAMWRGTRRLLLLTIPSPVKSVVRGLDNAAKLALNQHPHESVADLLEDCRTAAVDHLMSVHNAPAWTKPAFITLRDAVRAELAGTLFQVIDRVRQVLTARRDAEFRLAGMPSFTPPAALADVQAQMTSLVYRGFVTDTGLAQLPHVARYLRAIDRRLEKLQENPSRDADRMAEIATITAEYQRLVAGLPAAEAATEPVRRIRWMIEELRVSYFAQTLGTAYPVSEKRVYRAIDNLIG
ncbi:MAG TPA: ATP-dependent RNA helicase HrpA [Pseudonocardiaceae bacterium]|jgi:ATP-dependent helicase HrpA|nr:ATP-dependent RNA helicase HrpA [Pseudonocardiaceae bacterium]